jgi:TRAP-type uncharacterized transport system fused permease subunit
MSDRAKVRLGIYLLAAFVLIVLGVLRLWGVEQRILRIVAICGGLLVVMLLMTYRVFAGVVDDANRVAAAEKAAEDKSGNEPT